MRSGVGDGEVLVAAVTFVRLRPDRAPVSALAQHVSPVDPRRMPRFVPTFCGLRLDAFDLDPRFLDHPAGQPCPACLRNAPVELTMRLARVTGVLPELGTDSSAPAESVFVAGCAELGVRHLLPPRPPRGERLGRPVVLTECGHMGWCPVAGPPPSLDWPLCRGCLESVRRRTGNR